MTNVTLRSLSLSLSLSPSLSLSLSISPSRMNDSLHDTLKGNAAAVACIRYVATLRDTAARDTAGKRKIYEDNNQ